MEYKLIRDTVRNGSSFENTINELLCDGWILVGETKIVQIEKHSVLLQQMVRGVSSPYEKGGNMDNVNPNLIK